MFINGILISLLSGKWTARSKKWRRKRNRRIRTWHSCCKAARVVVHNLHLQCLTAAFHWAWGKQRDSHETREIAQWLASERNVYFAYRYTVLPSGRSIRVQRTSSVTRRPTKQKTGMLCQTGNSRQFMCQTSTQSVNNRWLLVKLPQHLPTTTMGRLFVASGWTRITSSYVRTSSKLYAAFRKSIVAQSNGTWITMNPMGMLYRHTINRIACSTHIKMQDGQYHITNTHPPSAT